MRKNSLIKVVWFLSFVFCSLQNLAAQNNSPSDAESDAAIASADVRHKLMNEYEAATNGFHDGHLLAVAVSYASEARYTQAIPVYQKFLSVHSSNVRALR